jgi:twitching motility protein PilT
MENRLNTEELLREVVKRGASDLHIKAGSPPMMRIDGQLFPIGQYRLSPHDTMQVASDTCPNHLLRGLEDPGSVDFAHSIPGLARFRVNCFHQRNSLSLVFRMIKFNIPPFEELYLPRVVQEMADNDRGLILVTGVTGSGKSTTLASMIDYINQNFTGHIITIEDPIEYLYRDDKCIINQIELGVDTLSYEDALKRVLRQDPDIILIGEIRDREAIRAAITAAETGHLVLSTLHTTNAIQTIERILEYFDPYEQELVRGQLAQVLKGVVSQRLLPRAEGHGRVPAVEIMVSTPIVQKLILENRSRDLKQAIQNGEAGMQSLDQALQRLYRTGMITLEDALEESENPTTLRRMVNGNHSPAEWKGLVGT